MFFDSVRLYNKYDFFLEVTIWGENNSSQKIFMVHKKKFSTFFRVDREGIILYTIADNNSRDIN